MNAASNVLSLTKQLATIQAPSKKEHSRASFCLEYLQSRGVNAFVDESNNVLVEFGNTETDPIVLFSAHTDIVFDETVPLTLREDGDRLYCPGIGDDTVHVAFLTETCIRLVKSKLPEGISFVFALNSGEEGEGNLYGCRALMQRYGDRLREMISLDSFLPTVNTTAVGSERFKVTVRTCGGHSFRDFGAPNAIALLSELICALQRQPIPVWGKTTFNFGCISGGTTVNSIAAEASLLYEYRSDRNESLSQMREQFRVFCAELSTRCAPDVTSIGVRPCAKDVPKEAQERLTERVLSCFAPLPTPSLTPASTDCNLPLSMGIPAVCIGLINGHGAHTVGEYIEKSSLSDGWTVWEKLLASYGLNI